MLFPLNLKKTAPLIIREYFLFALIAFTFSAPLLHAQEEKETPTALPPVSTETPPPNATTETPHSTPLPLPTPLPHTTTNNAQPALVPTSTPFSSIPETDSSISNTQTNPPSAPSIPSTPSVKATKADAADTHPSSHSPTKAPSAISTHSSFPAKSIDLPSLPPSTEKKGEATSSNNAAAIAAINNNPDEKISIQFPHTSILEALSLYEKLTGKRIIRDSNLAGPELSLMIADPVSKKDAISLLESTMLVNGYTVVPVDDKTVKIIGPSRPPRMEGLPLYQNVAELPNDGERLVSFYQPLHFLSPNEAINILQGVIQTNPYGSLVAVPNMSAIVITDKTPIIQKSLALLEIIDREPSQIITEFIPLQRADAEKTVETLNQIFGKEGTNSSPTPKPPTSPYQQPAPVTSSSNEETRIFSGKVQFIPDKRTNRILLVTKAENYRYIRDLIAKLDQAVQFEEPLVRPLNYVPVTDIFPVLVDLLKNKDDDSQNNNKSQSSSQNPFKNNNNNNSNPLDPNSGSSNVNAGGNHGDRLNDSAQLQPPQSAIIGSTSIVGDPTANSIIVYGPPESKIKARQIIDLLDRRPQQVYLAAVIGEMRLEEGMDYGTSYLFHYQGFNALMSGFTSAPSILPAATSIAAGAASGVGGLTVYGTLGSLDLYSNFLESTGRFKTISRPVVYTSNNRKATILSGQKIPYLSSTLSSVVAGANTASATNNTANSLTSNITYQDVLLKLEVIPLINSDKEVNLVIAQQNQSVNTVATAAAAKAGIQAPVVNTQELTTSVRVPSGSTIVLGGLIEDEKDNSETGIPYINKIPVIGQLLGSHTVKNKKRHELIVMISPTVITSNMSMEKASVTEGANTELGLRAKELKNKLQPKPTRAPEKKKFKLFQLPKQESF